MTVLLLQDYQASELIRIKDQMLWSVVRAILYTLVHDFDFSSRSIQMLTREISSPYLLEA